MVEGRQRHKPVQTRSKKSARYFYSCAAFNSLDSPLHMTRSCETNDALVQEGDLFSQRKLVKSFQNMSRLRTFDPLRLRDVVRQLNRSAKSVDMPFFVVA